MYSKNLREKMIQSINEIMDSIESDSKTETLAKQRGYLTGWLARLATQDHLIQQEVEAKLIQSKEKD